MSFSLREELPAGVRGNGGKGYWGVRGEQDATPPRRSGNVTAHIIG